MSEPSERHAPLSRKQAEDVLRYWLAAVQQEEALMARPKARAPSRGPSTPRLDLPGSGQDYFKLSLDQAAELFARSKGQVQGVISKPFDAELCAFFESWLTGQYRRGDQERGASHLLTFPVVHLPRGELAGLLRCPLELAFGDAGSGTEFSAPSRTQRRHNQFPPAPNEVRVALCEQPEQRLPFFVDTRLLQQQLGVVRERVDAMFEQLRSEQTPSPTRMLAVVCRLLEAEVAGNEPQLAADSGDEAVTPAQWITGIHSAVAALSARYGGRARTYPVALVLDGTRSRASFYLQRDIAGLVDEGESSAWSLDSCLGAYLTGDAPAPGLAVQRGLFRGPALSESQRDAAERCGGSRFTAVQGPPGTGKTTLILHLAAAALVRQVETLLRTGEMGDAVMLVTSTNNRAVDNVIDGLTTLATPGAPSLPLALRVGSQQVCEHVLLPVLEQVRTFLDNARRVPAAERAQALRSAIAQFETAKQRLQAAIEPREQACEALSQRAQIEAQLARVQQQLQAAPAPLLASTQLGRLTECLDKLRPRLEQLAALTEAKPSLPALQAVDREHKRLAKKLLPELQEACVQAGLSETIELRPQLPPSSDPVVLMEAWSEAVEATLSTVVGLQDDLEAQRDAVARRERERVLTEKLARLPSNVTALPPYDAEADALQRDVFEAAVKVREGWALSDCEELARAVALAIAAVRTDRSLRRLWKDGAPSFRRVRQLFGVWGCTLLSLGNCVPATPDALDLLVIDEAGQCHPAYAVSGLMRAQRALIIGDVHQLEPVIEIEPDDDERVVQACRVSLSRERLAPYRVHNAARVSVQSLADRAVSVRPSLVEHYRCQADIIRISDLLCDYRLHIMTPTEGPAVPLPFLAAPVSLVDVNGAQERQGGSWYNRQEVEHTIELLDSLRQRGVDPRDIAVITPYRGQLEQLRKRCVQLGLPLDRSLELLDVEDALPGTASGIALGTVHRFQGGERSVVLFSSVVTRPASLGFIDERANLLNVAVSRARHRLVVVGHAPLLAQGRRTRLLTEAAVQLRPEDYRAQLGLGL